MAENPIQPAQEAAQPNLPASGVRVKELIATSGLLNLIEGLTTRRHAILAVAVVLSIICFVFGAWQLRRDHAAALLSAEQAVIAQVDLLSSALIHLPNEPALTQFVVEHGPRLPAGWVIGLIGPDGAPLAISPVGSPAAAAIASLDRSGVEPGRRFVRYAALPTGGSAIISAAAVPPSGAVLALAVPTASVLSTWQEGMPFAVALMLLPGFLTALLGYLSLSEGQRGDEIEAQLKRKERRFETAFTDTLAQAAEIERRFQEDTAMRAAELAEAIERANQAEQVKSELLAAASHELRTPLNAIIGFSEIMVSGVLGPLGHAKYQEYISDIHRSGKRLLYVIDGLLTMARIKGNRTGLKPVEEDAGPILHECAALVRPFAEERQLRLVGKVGKPPAIIADRAALRQAVMNVLVNAIQFTEPGGRVTILCEPGETEVEISIHDTGIGISDPDLARLGAPFERANGSQGLGLGLAVAKSLIILQGGRFTIESAQGSGTTVRIVMPRADAKAAAADEAQTGLPEPDKAHAD